MVRLADCDKNRNFSLCENATQDFIQKSFRLRGLEQEKQRRHASLNLKINQKQNLNYDAGLQVLCLVFLETFSSSTQ